jgi:hypothetical protein
MQDKYDQLIIDHLKQLPNEKYIFEITKCCNYSTLVMVNKRGTSILDLYKEVSNWFECRTIRRLYLVGPTGEEITIPVTNVIELKEYIISNPTLFVPIYPIPNWVMYRIYLDDGHIHTEEPDDQK